MNPDIAVVYLSYVPFGTDLLSSFLESYLKKVPGIDHRLVIIFNGVQTDEDLEPFEEVIKGFGVQYEKILCDEPFDISAYFYAARRLKSDYFLFLNTYSVILAHNWLRYYYSAIQLPSVGIVGATGSGWRSGFSQFKNESSKSIFKNPRNFKAALSKWLHFGRFKGPHLRTNAFFIRRNLFLSLTYHDLHFKVFVPNFRKESKLKTLYFEHGSKNMTYQVNERGMKAVVIDKYGNVYEKEDWMKAKTLWISEQENLLIQDNQTLKYELGSEDERKQLTYWAWGIDVSGNEKNQGHSPC